MEMRREREEGLRCLIKVATSERRRAWPNQSTTRGGWRRIRGSFWSLCHLRAKVLTLALTVNKPFRAPRHRCVFVVGKADLTIVYSYAEAWQWSPSKAVVSPFSILSSDFYF